MNFPYFLCILQTKYIVLAFVRGKKKKRKEIFCTSLLESCKLPAQGRKLLRDASRATLRHEGQSSRFNALGGGWAQGQADGCLTRTEGPALAALPSPARRETAHGRCDWFGRPQRAPVCPLGLQSPLSASQSPPQIAGPSYVEKENKNSKQRFQQSSGVMSWVKPWFSSLFSFLGTKSMCIWKQIKFRSCRWQALATCQAHSICLFWSFTELKEVQLTLHFADDKSEVWGSQLSNLTSALRFGKSNRIIEWNGRSFT